MWTLAGTLLAIAGTASAQRTGAKAKYGEAALSVHKQHATTQICPDGYYLDGSRCVTKQEVPEEFSCPRGSVELGGQCLNYAAGRWECSDDLNLIGRTCLGRETVDKIKECPEGTIIAGDKCVYIDDIPFCPEGATMENGRCVVILPKLRRCPDGFANFGDVCVSRETEQPERHCPTGTVDDNGRCTITTRLEKVCPSGYEDVAGRCVAYLDEVERCPDAYRRAGSWCSRVDRVEKTIECSNGQSPADNCAVKVDVPLTPVCNVGKMWDGQCAQASFVPAVYSCPAGYDQQGTSCTKTLPYDCSTTEHDIVCDEPAVGKEAHLRSLAPEDLKAKYKTVEYGNRHPLPVCHKVPRTVPKTCEKTITAQSEAYCADGVLRSGNRCEIATYTAPDQECKATSGPNGECYVTEISTPLRSCPEGYTNEGTRCVKTLTTAPVWACPRGTDGPNCQSYKDKICPGGGQNCETTITEPAKFICPEGFKKRPDGQCQVCLPRSHHTRRGVQLCQPGGQNLSLPQGLNKFERSLLDHQQHRSYHG
eukprot:Selendium_serpulae@DN6340_c3_g1_i10.p1